MAKSDAFEFQYVPNTYYPFRVVAKTGSAFALKTEEVEEMLEAWEPGLKGGEEREVEVEGGMLVLEEGGES